MQITDLPFNQWIGITVADDCVRLQPNSKHENHLGTVHATALFGVAEAASGHWLIREFPELGNHHVALLRTTKLKYRVPAESGVEIAGSANCNAESILKFRQTLADRGRATLDIHVQVTQNEIELLSGTMSWFATQNA